MDVLSGVLYGGILLCSWVKCFSSRSGSGDRNRCPIRVVAEAFGSLPPEVFFFSWVSDGLLLFLSPLSFLISFLFAPSR